mmetsp:Transcript_49793/g.132066  ORF Transcript_49793/g.132066 Transcript_49793/m.132066 type:complete len:266 (-) Transcript_49793:3875-4672(-)
MVRMEIMIHWLSVNEDLCLHHVESLLHASFPLFLETPKCFVQVFLHPLLGRPLYDRRKQTREEGLPDNRRTCYHRGAEGLEHLILHCGTHVQNVAQYIPAELPRRVVRVHVLRSLVHKLRIASIRVQKDHLHDGLDNCDGHQTLNTQLHKDLAEIRVHGFETAAGNRPRNGAGQSRNFGNEHSPAMCKVGVLHGVDSCLTERLVIRCDYIVDEQVLEIDLSRRSRNFKHNTHEPQELSSHVRVKRFAAAHERQDVGDDQFVLQPL